MTGLVRHWPNHANHLHVRFKLVRFLHKLAGTAATAPWPDGDMQRTDTSLAVEATGLVKTFGKVRAVDGIDLEVRRGEVFGVLGPNGAGKTTMLQMLATLLPIDGGRPRSSASTSPATRTRCASWSA